MIHTFVKYNYTQPGKSVAIADFFCKVSLIVGVILLTVYIRVVGQPAQKMEPIVLHAEPFPFTPKEFYIADIIDERVNRAAVAYLFSPTNNSTQPPTLQPVDLQGGGLAAIRQFIRQGLSHNTKLRPVVIRLKECQITESQGAQGRVDGLVVVSMSFDWQREGETVHLVDYIGGGASYNRPAGGLTAVEQALRQSLISALRFFNTWMNREASTNDKLATGIKVSFTDYIHNMEDDTVFYATNRPLIWEDFRDKPQLSRYAASVFPSFAYEGPSKVVDGILHINLIVKVYVLKNSSWVKQATKDAYGLNHEQRHFDIAKLVAERFKQKIHPDSLTVEDYNSIIQYHYLESFREMNRIQEQYDGETRHGLDQAAQARWNQRIDEELRAFAIKE